MLIVVKVSGYQQGNLAEWSKALVSGTSLRAWVRIPQLSYITLSFLTAEYFRIETFKLLLFNYLNLQKRSKVTYAQSILIEIRYKPIRNIQI